MCMPTLLKQKQTQKLSFQSKRADYCTDSSMNTYKEVLASTMRIYKCKNLDGDTNTDQKSLGNSPVMFRALEKTNE